MRYLLPSMLYFMVAFFVTKTHPGRQKYTSYESKHLWRSEGSVNMAAVCLWNAMSGGKTSVCLLLGMRKKREWEKEREREREGHAGVVKGFSSTVSFYLSSYYMWGWRIPLGCGFQGNSRDLISGRTTISFACSINVCFSVRPYGTCTNHQTLKG